MSDVQIQVIEESGLSECVQRARQEEDLRMDLKELQKPNGKKEECA